MPLPESIGVDMVLPMTKSVEISNAKISNAELNKLSIPEALLPRDGRFGSGPSKIRHAQVESLEQGWNTLLGTSHRQQPVRQVVASIRAGLRKLFSLPEGYEIALGNGGASAFWDIACASLIDKTPAFGVYGSFSRKFAQEAANTPFIEKTYVFESDPGTYTIPEFRDDADAYCWAHNETSTGVAAPVRRVPGSAENGALTLVDGTSAAGALHIDITQCDVYYFSPQKAFGSDGGLWFAILSPAAIERAERVEAEAKRAGSHRWIPAVLSLSTALSNSRKEQTLNTPSVATLILMDQQLRWMNEQGGMPWTEARCSESSDHLYQWAQASSFAQPFVSEVCARSNSVVTIDIDDRFSADEIIASLRANGIVDTAGYRKLGRNQLRIGVFPSVDPDDVRKLTQCIDYVVEHL
jgi:phosphoserine aminotransferase